MSLYIVFEYHVFGSPVEGIWNDFQVPMYDDDEINAVDTSYEVSPVRKPILFKKLVKISVLRDNTK